MDTIYALSTAPGKAGVAIVRVSGPLAFEAATRLCASLPEPRRAARRTFVGSDSTPIDDALVLTFEEGASFTGEQVVEFHTHGSVAVTTALLAELGRIARFRAAEPGEFTRRALENGQLDLAQVEGLADLIEAETDAQRRQALRVLSGDLGKRADIWRSHLIRAAALLEATIDFADEEVPVDVSPEVTNLLSTVTQDLQREIDGVAVAERVRAGFEVAIVGRPNAGKSTLLNALAGRDAAITSEYAGTTRDVIEVRMDLNGVPVTLLDTAGLRETDDAVEAIGVERARTRAQAADVRVFLVEPGELPDLDVEPNDLVLISKIDTRPGAGQGVSGKTGAGLPDLMDSLSDTFAQMSANDGVATRLRHQDAMERGLARIGLAQDALNSWDDQSELAAEELRGAVRALDSLVGRIDIENVLDEIFASFCLGK
ncbi:MAG: tRNA uridine-5-carboxymethylaminomethyl(34) synthesis GTPase MnmE [Pseudomonadota bacterium]